MILSEGTGRGVLSLTIRRWRLATTMREIVGMSRAGQGVKKAQNGPENVVLLLNRIVLLSSNDVFRRSPAT
jgi:hypothetical protein